MSTDFVQEVDLLKQSKHSFYLNRDGWEKVKLPTELKWERLEFNEENASSVPKNPGVYAFLVSPKLDVFPPFSFIMYIGISGWKEGSSSTLRERYKNYIREEVNLIRPKIHYALQRYKGLFYFYYAPVDSSKYKLKEIEAALNDAIIPPCNDNDYSAEMRKKVKAAGL